VRTEAPAGTGMICICELSEPQRLHALRRRHNSRPGIWHGRTGVGRNAVRNSWPFCRTGNDRHRPLRCRDERERVRTIEPAASDGRARFVDCSSGGDNALGLANPGVFLQRADELIE